MTSVKHYLCAASAALAMGFALPALAESVSAAARSSDAMQVPVEEGRTVIATRTVVVSETPIYGQQIAHALENNKDASRFSALLSSSGLEGSLRDNEKGYTVFVPLNAAFRNDAAQSAAEAGKVDPMARTVLNNHIVDAKYDLNLMHGLRDNVKSLSGQDIVISKVGKSYYANGHLIVAREHNPEGIIYYIEGFITSPEQRSAVYNPADATK